MSLGCAECWPEPHRGGYGLCKCECHSPSLAQVVYYLDAAWSPTTGWEIKEWRNDDGGPAVMWQLQRPKTFAQQWAEEWLRLLDVTASSTSEERPADAPQR